MADIVITHRIVTYFKRPKGEPGITQLGSQRLNTLEALNWVLSHMPDDAFTIDDTEAAALVLRLDRQAFDLQPSRG